MSWSVNFQCQKTLSTSSGQFLLLFNFYKLFDTVKFFHFVISIDHVISLFKHFIISVFTLRILVDVLDKLYWPNTRLLAPNFRAIAKIMTKLKNHLKKLWNSCFYPHRSYQKTEDSISCSGRFFSSFLSLSFQKSNIFFCDLTNSHWNGLLAQQWQLKRQ